MKYDYYQAPKFSLREALTPLGDNRKNREWNTGIITLQSFIYGRRSRPCTEEAAAGRQLLVHCTWYLVYFWEITEKKGVAYSQYQASKFSLQETFTPLLSLYRYQVVESGNCALYATVPTL